MSWSTDLSLLLMLVAANGAPVLVAVPCAQHCAWTVDEVIGRAIGRGSSRMLFGAHKTVRGVVAAIAAALAVAGGCGWPIWIGLVVGVAAMLGDFGSSFVKRRLGIAPGTQVFGLDQLPEALLPALAVAIPLHLEVFDVLAVVAGFVVLELSLTGCWSRLMRRRVAR